MENRARTRAADRAESGQQHEICVSESQHVCMHIESYRAALLETPAWEVACRSQSRGSVAHEGVQNTGTGGHPLGVMAKLCP